MVGGSSGVNGMAWVRPPKQELDSWPETVNISGDWNWDGLLPYMMKVENVNVDDSSPFPCLTHPSGSNNAIQGRKGPIQVSFDNTFSGVEAPWVRSFRNAGGVINKDPVRLVFSQECFHTSTYPCSRLTGTTLVSPIHSMQ